MLADSLQELFDERLYGGRGTGNDTRSLRVGGQQLGRFVQHADALAVFEGFGKKPTDLVQFGERLNMRAAARHKYGVIQD